MIRVHNDLAKYLSDIAKKNNIKITEASRQIIKPLRGKKVVEQKIIREIKF